MTKEINALERNGTWTLTTLPTNKTPIGCKWVYRIKYFTDGAVEKYKARLVAKGFTQKEGIDFKEIFARVAKMVTVRVVIAVAIHNNWYLEQLDVNNAFLHGDLFEEVYMKVLQGYATSLPPNTVCKLNKSLYGLKQANRQWFTKLTDFLTSLNINQSYADTPLFTLNQDGHTIFLLVYVDDILLTSDSSLLLQHIKQQLHNKKYALKLLQYAGVLKDKPTIIPLDLTKQLNDIDGDPLPDPSMYRTLVGKLIYLTITKPDLSFAAQLLSQFSKQPRTTHMKALLKVLRYIKLCPGQGLYFPANNSLHLKAFCDSDWASCPITRRSVTNWLCHLSRTLSYLLAL
uniref:Retrovirus-related Pol polyprotein from transposon TNT 1-94 n=1 Tax=Tanacetum cinerariifolium TaxID=118510 RepID=A0A6L2MNT7_TANCI|nr:retrovirus-related Pol polyprotein from transposon TNT 1-94 [Tanacetum cinerariifolium]